MQEIRCKAITKSGKQCKIKANSSGYCHIHDPEAIAQREAASQPPEILDYEIPKHRFSQRKGYTPVSTTLQIEGMSPDLRVSLWNVLFCNSLDPGTTLAAAFDILSDQDTDFSVFRKDLWTDFYKQPLDMATPTRKQTIQSIYERFEAFEWYEVYDFVEYILNYMGNPKEIAAINHVLERELSAYRFVGGCITEIMSKQEIEMLESALTDDEFPKVNTHLKRALALMSDRKEPDYRNSVKESISAVESLARRIANKPNASLGDALNVLERSNIIHPALKKSFTSLYGYTSDANGIRHALSDEDDITVADAKFFLLSCTSFINYLKAKM